jgi:hypothetical protein
VVDIQKIRIHQVHLGTKAEDLVAQRKPKIHLAHSNEGESKRMLPPRMMEAAGVATPGHYTSGPQEED